MSSEFVTSADPLASVGLRDLPSLLDATDRSLGLPVRKPICNVPWDPQGSDGWAANYGGIQVLAQHARLISGLPVSFNATWTHGILEPSAYKHSPLQLLAGIQHEHDRMILVVDAHQKSALVECGFRNVHAIGAPFVYAKPRVAPARIPGSTLLMPPHIIDDAPFDQPEQMDRYCDFAATKYHPASNPLVYASLHLSCVKSGQWWPQLLKRNIPVLGGAAHSDANSYRRMWYLFSMFETISTPVTNLEVGSHVFYALAAGCRVVFEGPGIEYSRSQLSNDLSFRRSVDNDDMYIGTASFLEDKRCFCASFSSPRADQAFGDEMVGTAFKRSPAEIRSLLGWSRREQFAKELKRVSATSYFHVAFAAQGLKKRFFNAS